MFVTAVALKPRSNNNSEQNGAAPFCQCTTKQSEPTSWNQLNACDCGEEHNIREWKWQNPDATGYSWVVVSDNQKQVTFHPYYSSGTAAVKGDTAMQLNNHYYWEVKMLTETYGTDIMVGVGTDKVNIEGSQFKFTSLLGQDSESYGLSYTGDIRHNATIAKYSSGFCRGSIIGVRVDMWQGTLEFYLNRKSQGISFYNLRRHGALYPMMCSTAAQSSLRLTYAASWKASLLVDAAKTLAASVAHNDRRMSLPPGLWYKLKSQFWLTLPTEGCILDDDEEMPKKKEIVKTPANVLSEVLPSQYMNGFYVDNVDRNYRVVVWE